MQKPMYFERLGKKNLAAVVEAGKLGEFHADDVTENEKAGKIFKGGGVNVPAGMQAAVGAYGGGEKGGPPAGGKPRPGGGGAGAAVAVAA